MRTVDLLRTKGTPTISFEITRPKTPKGEANIGNVLDRMVALRPDFLTMTFGAGGGTRDISMQMLHRMVTERGQEVVAHLAGYGMSPGHLDETVDGFKDIGVENLLVIRGDRPGDENFRAHPGSFTFASDMIRHLHLRHGMCIGAAAYPEGHVEASGLDADIEQVKKKVANGAEFIICQYFYDNRFYFNFIEKCRAAGITVPVIVGVMPIYSIRMMNILADLCGATITEEVNVGLAALPPDDKAAINDWGVEFAIRQCTELIASGVDGLHFYTLNRTGSVTGIVQGLRASGALV